MSNNFNDGQESDRFIGNTSDYSYKINDNNANFNDLNSILENRASKDVNDALNNYVPIGTVLSLKNKDDKLMVIGYKLQKESIIFDYFACNYPYGIDSNHTQQYFNKEDIEKIYHIGYIDEQEKKYVNGIEENTDGKSFSI